MVCYEDMTYPVYGVPFYPQPRLSAASSVVTETPPLLNSDVVGLLDENVPRKRLRHHTEAGADTFAMQKHAHSHTIHASVATTTGGEGHLATYVAGSAVAPKISEKHATKHLHIKWPLMPTTAEGIWSLQGGAIGGAIGTLSASVFLLIGIGIKRFLRWEGMHSTIPLATIGGGLVGYAFSTLLYRFQADVNKHLQHSKTK
jgi:hypothetical protein